MSPLNTILERRHGHLLSASAALNGQQFSAPDFAAPDSTPVELAPAAAGLALRDQTNKGDDLPAVRRECVNTRPVTNRIFAVMMHTTRYAFKAQARLAADCGVSPSTISRLLTGFSSPSFALVDAVTKALEKQLKIPLDPRELVSVDGQFPTRFTCALCRCRGCLPYEAWDDDDQLQPAYRDIQPGTWTLLSSQSVKRALNEDSCVEVEPPAAPDAQTGQLMALGKGVR